MYCILKIVFLRPKKDLLIEDEIKSPLPTLENKNEIKKDESWMKSNIIHQIQLI